MARARAIEPSTFERIVQILSDLEYCFDHLLEADEALRLSPCAIRAAGLKADRLARKISQATGSDPEAARRLR